MNVVENNKRLSLNLKGRLVSLDTPLVMGILNLTPDSFYAGSRCESHEAIRTRVRQILDEGASIIDVGAYSSRPHAADISTDEEMRRLSVGLEIIFREYPDAIVSVDTFRSEVGRRCVKEYGVAMINDISGGESDPAMFETVAALQVPYVMMHMRGTPQTMTTRTHYDDLIAEMLYYFACKVDKLRLLSVNDIILDPGFGFSKSLDGNYTLMQRLSVFQEFGLPLLAGVSRKSMIYRFLGTTPEESLNGTTVLNTLSLLGGADILRVHDVKPAVETVRLVTKTLMMR